MNQLPGPPSHHPQQPYTYHQPPAQNLGPVTQPCFNCGQMTHWAQQCPEPRRNVPAGSTQPKPRVRSKNGPGPIITRYPRPQQAPHPAPYPTPVYGAPPPLPSPAAHSPQYPQHPAHQVPPPQPYGAHYGAPPPPPPPHAIPPQPPHSHYPPPPPPPPPHAPQYSYQSPVNGQYPTPTYPPQYPPPTPQIPAHHHSTPYYPPQPHPTHPVYPQATYQTPVPQHSPHYQFYPPQHPHHPPPQHHQHVAPSHAPHYTPHQHVHAPTQHSGRHHHRQHSINQSFSSAPPPTPLSSHQSNRGSISEASPSNVGVNVALTPVRRPLAATAAETEREEAENPTKVNEGQSICKYWDKEGNRTKYHLTPSDLANDPAIKSFRTGLSRLVVVGPVQSKELDDTGDVAMDLGSASSADGRPDVTDKLNGILSRQSSDHGTDSKTNAEVEAPRRRNTRDDGRRGRSKSPSNQDLRTPYRSRTPNGGGSSTSTSRMQYSLPTKPDPVNMKPQAKSRANSSVSNGTANTDAPGKLNGRSRSASPRRNSEDDKRRHRDYDNRYKETSQEKPKSGRENNNKRRTSGTNGVPAAFARRW